jgi:TetR/AcrR family transcriptional repressor of nem operon
MNAQAHQSKTKLLEAALTVFRSRGYTATTVDDICREAGVTKGSFFHHFKGKEELAIESTRYWTEVTGQLFAQAPYHRLADPRDRVLGYIDFRAAMLAGEIPDFTCLLGTMVQETYETHPAIREACRAGFDAHIETLVDDFAQAKALYAPRADWSAESLALHTQAVIQGAFIFAKAHGGPQVAAQSIAHLRRYVQAALNGADQPQSTPSASPQPGV